MKRLSWISRSLICLAIFSNCKGTAGNNKSHQSAVGETSELKSAPVDSIASKSDTTKETLKQPAIPASDSLKKATSRHNAPNQEEIDSIKKFKTKAKAGKGL